MITVQTCVISTLCQRVVHNLVEATSNKLLPYNVLKLVLVVLVSLDYKRAFQLCRYLHIIIPVDAQDVFNHITRTLHIDTIRWNAKLYTVTCLRVNLHFQACDDRLYHFRLQVLAYQAINIIIFQRNLEVLHRFRINIVYFHRHLAPGKFLAHDGCLLQRIYYSIGVYSTLKAERCVRAKAVAACAFPYPCRMEIRAFKDYVPCSLIRAAALSAKYAGYAHGIFLVAYCKVV